jgi:diguanylate cyclase (GGDEF)-like protein
MRNRECNGANHPAGWRGSDGRLYFPTVEGLVEVDPRRLVTNPLPPPVVIESLVADGRAVAPRNGLVFEPGTESFEIQYAGLAFGVPERVRFRYKLENLDRDWVDVGSRRNAYYTRIPPGEYRFRVAAANEDGVWNEEGASLSFQLRPPFYRTWWFLALTALGAAAAILGGYRLRERQAQQREATLVRLVEQRTRELEEANRRLERLSLVDGLTGLANRRRFDEALDSEWRRGCRARMPLSLMLVDVDEFKLFNDTYGHLEGDACLKRVAGALSACLSRAADLGARFGGEEFVAILPHASADEAARLAERLRERVLALAIPHSSSPVAGVVTVSVGCATAVPTEAERPDTLLASADSALYAAKRAGRNRVVSA